MSTISSLKDIERFHEKICKSLGEPVMKIIIFKKEKNEMINKKKQQELYENTKICINISK